MGKPSKKEAAAIKAAKKPNAPKKATVISFVEQVTAKAKTDNPGNLALFQERTIRYSDRQLLELEDKMIDARANLDDCNTIIKEESLKVELTSIGSIANINDYIPHYVSNIEDAINAAKAKSKELVKLQDRMEIYSIVKALLK